MFTCSSLSFEFLYGHGPAALLSINGDGLLSCESPTVRRRDIRISGGPASKTVYWLLFVTVAGPPAAVARPPALSSTSCQSSKTTDLQLANLLLGCPLLLSIMIVCVAVVGHQNNPLYLQSFTDADDALKLHHIVHCSLDVIDERVNNPKKAGSTFNETFLGLLYPTENYKVYGYLTNTKVKFILVTTDLDVKDADVRNFFRKFHSAYVDAISNPFHVPGKKISSATFADRVSTIVKSFGSTAAV